ncbi:MAG: archaellin/type IV pilin N-terminal domain-containing protein [Candidatus Bathyarchaeia archaeon]
MKTRRAISPVISALLLIILTVAAGVVAYAYVMGWLGGVTKSSGAEYGKLQFDSLYANATSNKITIYVRNVGQKDLTIEKVYVDGVDQTFTLTDKDLSVQEVSGKIEVTYTMTKGYFYEVKVTCKDGTSVSQSVEAK